MNDCCKDKVNDLLDKMQLLNKKTLELKNELKKRNMLRDDIYVMINKKRNTND
tara:strand:- start:2617 stop:2775 length:159 start_codon:yes stop_codon:yes gene_type:complete